MRDMSDKSLLEKAGKAAGYELDSDCFRLDDRDSGGAPKFWNPLEDDGDALRLAIALNLPIVPHTHGIGWVDVGHIKELCGSDSLAATRRAIVRAAASKSSHPTP